MLEVLFNLYCAFSFTHNYIMGFAFNGMIYFSVVTSDVVKKVLYVDNASTKNGGGLSIRYRPNKTQKQVLYNENAIALCSIIEFESMVKNTRYNRGEIFEKLVTEYYNQTWIKDNVPFNKGGDIEINGIPYQIKYEKATFASEKYLRNLQENPGV